MVWWRATCWSMRPGRFQGSGTINGNVTVSGLFNAGNSPGTINIGGNLTLNSSSTTVVEIASISLSDLYAVTGSAALDGTLQVVQLSGYSPQDGDAFTILTAGGGVTGTFGTLTGSPAGLAYGIVYNANDVAISITAIPYINSATSPNQIGVANVIDTIRATATGDWLTLTNELNTLSTAQLQNALDQIVPEEVGAMATVSFGGSSVQATNVSARLSEVRAGSRGGSSRNFRLANLSNDAQQDLLLMSLASNQSGPVDTLLRQDSDNPWGVFVAGSGTFGDVDSTSNQAGYDFRTGGVTLGMDRRLNEQMVVGGMLGYADSNVDVDSNGGEVDVNSVKFGAYGTYYQDALYINWMLGGGHHMYDADRTVQFGAIDRTASSDPDAWEFSAMVGAGYNYQVGSWRVAPTGSLIYSRLDIEGYSESGAGALNLKGGSPGSRFAYRTARCSCFDTDSSQTVADYSGAASDLPARVRRPRAKDHGSVCHGRWRGLRFQHH